MVIKSDHIKSLLTDAAKGIAAAYVGDKVCRFLFRAAEGRLFSSIHGIDLTLFSMRMGEYIVDNNDWETDRQFSAYLLSPNFFSTGASTYANVEKLEAFIKRQYRESKVYLKFVYKGVPIWGVNLLKSEILNKMLSRDPEAPRGGEGSMLLFDGKHRKIVTEFVYEYYHREAENRRKEGMYVPMSSASKDNEPVNQHWGYMYCGGVSSWTSALDDLPINSIVREKLDAHVEWVKSNWDAGKNVTRHLMLSGTPGTGKTAIAYAMRKELCAGGYMFPSDNVTGGSFQHLMAAMQPKSVCVIDEIDAIEAFWVRPKSVLGNGSRGFAIFESSNKAYNQQDAFGALTGPRSPRGILFVSTTNYPNKIDPAILRLGRTKEQIDVPWVDHKGIVRWLEHIYQRPYTGPEFPAQPLNYIFSVKEDAVSYEHFLELLHEFTPDKLENVFTLAEETEEDK